MMVVEWAWPLAAMAFAAFLAGTLLPLSSEAALAAAIVSGTSGKSWLVVAATLGNVLGSVFNWWMGLNARRFEGRRWFPFGPAAIAKASDRFRRHGSWCLLFSWLPVVGDPLTFVAGVLKVRLMPFLALVACGKAARYIVLAAAL